MSNPANATRRAGIAWSAFLGVSWTWCIGMFLPVLFVRDFGVAGFLVFAVPNVIGAAAMGSVLRDAQQSRTFVANHRAACAAFSIVTILFHLFFLAWAASTFLLIPSAALLAFVPLVICLLVFFRSDRAVVAIAWIVLLVSLTIFGTLALRFPHAASALRFEGRLPSFNLLGLAVVCILGFLTCPYLDLTFHHARQNTSPSGGAVAFRVGFGICFASMILFTLWYAIPLQSLNASEIDFKIARLVGIHIVIQSAFTIAAHLRALVLNWDAKALLGSGVAVVASVTIPIAGAISPTHLPGGSGEGIYRLFMTFYGLIFPAYICARVGAIDDARSWLAWGIACLLAAPFLWLGFIDEKMLWLIPGAAVILSARMLTSAGPIRAPEIAGPSIVPRGDTTPAP